MEISFVALRLRSTRRRTRRIADGHVVSREKFSDELVSLMTNSLEWSSFEFHAFNSGTWALVYVQDARDKSMCVFRVPSGKLLKTIPIKQHDDRVETCYNGNSIRLIEMGVRGGEVETSVTVFDEATQDFITDRRILCVQDPSQGHDTPGFIRVAPSFDLDADRKLVFRATHTENRVRSAKYVTRFAISEYKCDDQSNEDTEGNTSKVVIVPASKLGTTSSALGLMGRVEIDIESKENNYSDGFLRRCGPYTVFHHTTPHTTELVVLSFWPEW